MKIQVSIPDHIIFAVDRHAKRTKSSRNEFVHSALLHYLDRSGVKGKWVTEAINLSVDNMTEKEKSEQKHVQAAFLRASVKALPREKW